MKQWVERPRARCTWLPLLCVAQFGFLVARTRGGMFTSGDGESYLRIAQTFSTGDFGLDPSASVPYLGLRIHWPPGYPTVLSLCSALTGLTLTQSAFLINALSLLALTIGVDRLVRMTWPPSRGRGSWPIVLTVHAAVGAPTIFMAARVLPEVAFSAASVWFLIAVLRLNESPTFKSLPAAVALGLLATSLKWSGAFLVIGAVGVLGLRDLRHRRVPGTPVVLAAAVGIGAWSWTNWVRSFPGGQLSEHGETGVLSAPVSLLESVVAFGSSALGLLQGRSGNALGRGSFPLPSPLAGAAFAVCAIVGFVVLGMFALTAWHHLKSLLSGDKDLCQTPSDSNVVAMGTLAAYIVLNQVTRSRWGYFVLPRYWGVLPILCWLFVAADFARHDARAERFAWATAVAAMSASLVSTIYLLR